jgi:hypothetical protein
MESIGAKYGQWIIWSAASVSNADTASALDKFKSRAYGALVGVAGLAVVSRRRSCIACLPFPDNPVIKRYVVSLAHAHSSRPLRHSHSTRETSQANGG